LTSDGIRSERGADRPVVASYCATFLKPEMLHIYRQITALERVRPIVVAQKREHPELFPFEPVTVVPKSPLHFARRFWFKQIRVAPWQLSRGEVRQIEAALTKANAGLLHVYFGHIAVHLVPVIRASRRPAVVSFHGADVMVDMDKPAYRAATARMLDAVTMVLVRSESLRRAVVDLGCDASKIRIHRTGIPLSEFAFRTRDWPHDGRWRFVQACRLIEKKGLETSVRAFAEFARTHPHAQFTIAGDGPLRASLSELATQLGVARQIEFTGFVSQPEMRERFYSAHIFLHPSEVGKDGNQEGVPNSMLEAMATGLPVFATAHGGIPEAIDDGVSGVLVAEGDHAALARALEDWTSAPDRLSQIARAGSDAVAASFEQRAQVRQLEDYYFEAIGAAAAAKKLAS
jgi:colanic acid/amylovoran biosynthesis glycosyltransferase